MGDTTGTPVYEHATYNTGIDPTLLAALGAGGNGGGMFGGNGNNSLWPLLFLFGRGMGTWGGAGLDGYGGGAAAGFAARTLASEATMTSKDVTAQLTAFQHWCCENSAMLQQAINGIDKSICCSTRDILGAVNALTPQMYQSFSTLTQGMNQGFASAQLANCQSTASIQHALCEGFHAACRQQSDDTAQLTQTMTTGFAANALSSQRDTLETRNAIDHSIHRVEATQRDVYNNLQSQADRIALQGSIQRQAETNALNLQMLQNANAAALAAAEMRNQMAACCCEIKGTIHEDGQLTRALINDQEVMRLRSQLADAKEGLSNANQSILIGEQINRAVGTVIHHIPQPAPVYYPGYGGTNVDVDVTQRQRQRQNGGAPL